MSNLFSKDLTSPRKNALTNSYSIYLDFLRAGAALTVFLHHFAFPNFTDGHFRILNAHEFGADAVIVFFVLSGLIIAFCGDQKDTTLRGFAFSRATRLFSVAIPALCLGWLADTYGAALYPDYYASIRFNQISFVQQMLSGLTFTNEWVFTNVRLGTNGPFWSLSFEVAYYIMFALVFYLSSHWRWVAAGAVGLFLGPTGLVLLPCWLMGWAVWKIISSPVELPHSVALLFALTPPVIYLASILADGVELLQMIGGALMADTLHSMISGRASNYLWFNIVGVLTAVHLLGMHSLVRNTQISARSALVRLVRFVASCSFSIYLVHYPVMHFLSPTLRVMPSGLLRDLVLAVATLGTCILVAMVFERTLGSQRRAINRVLRRQSTQSQQPSH